MSCFKNMPSHRIQAWYIYQRKALHLLSCSGGRWVFVLSLRPSTVLHPKNRHASLQTSFLPASTFPDTVNFFFLNLKTRYPSMTTESAKAVHPETPCAALPRVAAAPQRPPQHGGHCSPQPCWGEQKNGVPKWCQKQRVIFGGSFSGDEL